MAGYIRDPEYIRALVQREYGAHRAPPLDTIKLMQADHQYLRAKFRDQYGDAPENDNLPEWRPVSLVTAPKPEPVLFEAMPKPEQLETVELLPSRRIIKGTAAAFKMSVADLLGKDRHKRFVVARAVAIRLLREQTWSDGTLRFSYPQIGRMMGGRDHSTVIHAINNFELYCRLHPEAKAAYDTLKEAIG